MKDALEHEIPKYMELPFKQKVTVQKRFLYIADEIARLNTPGMAAAMARVDAGKLMDALNKMGNDILDLMPYAVCDPCLSEGKEGDFTCPHCQGTGWVTKAELHRAFEAGLEEKWWRSEKQFVDETFDEVISCKTIPSS